MNAETLAAWIILQLPLNEQEADEWRQARQRAMERIREYIAERQKPMRPCPFGFFDADGVPKRTPQAP